MSSFRLKQEWWNMLFFTPATVQTPWVITVIAIRPDDGVGICPKLVFVTISGYILQSKEDSAYRGLQRAILKNC